MKKLTTSLCLIFSLFLFSATSAWSADFDKGFDAAQKGDYATAVREWTPLAEQGDAFAQHNLGLMYANGEGIPQDYQTAFKWFSLAAEQGYAGAQNNLGWMYRSGHGVPHDYQTAAKWYSLAAEQGNALAQHNLGLMYANGYGVPQDNVYAHMWFDIAASLGDKGVTQNRDIVAKKMTPADISAAQTLTRECVKKNYKDC
jgi:TPR repeat protein